MSSRFVSRNETKECRKFINNLIGKIHKTYKNNIKFLHRYAGSLKWGTIVSNDENKWDIDVQLVVYRVKNKDGIWDKKIDNTTSLRNELYTFFKVSLNEFNGEYKLENSTSVLTINSQNKKWSIDFAILRDKNRNAEFEINRRNNKNKSSTNEFTWNKLWKWKDEEKLFKWYKNLSIKNERLFTNLRQQIINEKIANKKDEKSFLTSIEITMNIINKFMIGEIK